MSYTQSTLTSTSALAPRSTNVPPAPKQSAGQKRKGNDSAAPQIALDESDLEEVMMTQTCNQVRGKIRRLIDSGEMSQTAFNKLIGVSDNSMRTFLGQNGSMAGSGSNSYVYAHAYFTKREALGVKIPTKKQKVDGTEKAKDKQAKNNIDAAGNSAGVDISAITLQGEDSDDVEIYDSCDEIRKKISAHLRKPGVTQAQFCRDLQAQMHSSSAPKFRSVMLTRFRGMKGAHKGASNAVFYAAYVFFEKVRLQQGKQKSKHRLEMEKIWPRGMSREKDSGWFFCRAGEYPHEDEFGRVTFHS